MTSPQATTPLSPHHPHAATLRARVLDNRQDGRLYRRLRLTRPPELGYERPGQYVAMVPATRHPELEARYFVLASSLEEDEYIDFIIKMDGDTAIALTDLRAGEEVLLTPALGSGFAVERSEGQHLVCFASGSGIAAILPTVSWVLGHPTLQVQGIWVYYGETELDDFAASDVLSELEARGVHVGRACAAEPQHVGGARFVQEAFLSRGPVLREATFIVCGSSKMQEALAALLEEAGLDPKGLLRNY